MILYINKDRLNRGYIISICKDENYSDEEMAEFLHIDEIDYMNILSLHGCIKYERMVNDISTVESIFEDEDIAKKCIDELNIL